MDMNPVDRQMLTEIHTNTEVMRQRLTDHIDNAAIHQVPPCPFQQKTDSRIWAALTTGIVSLGGALYAIFTK